MRIRASWRDPYSGVPLMFTSSSPGCSRRDRAALPPSSTWETERGASGVTGPRSTLRVVLFAAEDQGREASESGWLHPGHQGETAVPGSPPAPVT